MSSAMNKLIKKFQRNIFFIDNNLPWQTFIELPWQRIYNGKMPKYHGKTHFAMANANFKCIFTKKVLKIEKQNILTFKPLS
jgi:hypothetical protein